MAYRKVILAEAQQKYRDIVGYLVGVLQSKQAARKGMLTKIRPKFERFGGQHVHEGRQA